MNQTGHSVCPASRRRAKYCSKGAKFGGTVPAFKILADLIQAFDFFLDSTQLNSFTYRYKEFLP
jgi:hypothetical protein